MALSRGSRGFALLELLIVIAIMALLAGAGWYVTSISQQGATVRVGASVEQAAHQAVQAAASATAAEEPQNF